MFHPLLSLALLALVSPSSARLVSLSTFSGEETYYKVNQTSKIYVISDSSQDLLQLFKISSDQGNLNSNGFTLSVPQADGSLTPLIPTSDGVLLSVAYSGETPLSGYLYINSVTPNLNVFPLFTNSSIQAKQGTNVFFKTNSPTDLIPVAQNVVVNDNQQLTGFVGLPDESTPVQFFDSKSIDGVTNYGQLELPMERFHLVSNNAAVKYNVNFSARNEMSIGSSGLVMTDGFPNGNYGTRQYALNNQNGINVEATFVPVMDKTRFYSGNITLLMTTTALQPIVFPMFSNGVSNITSNSPISKIVIESDGPFAIQYFLRDTTVTTPSPFETSTKSASVQTLFVSLLTVFFFKF